MNNHRIAARRLYSQHVAGPPLSKPEDVVDLLCAVQAQDYAGAKWALAQRLHNTTDAGLDKVFNDGAILRTHVMRPTWHFVLPSDIRWMLELTAPRVNAINAHYYRRNELDAATLARSNEVLAKALQGGNFLTRQELAQALGDAGIPASSLTLGLIVMHAELDAIICSGPRRGKQFTYALLEERAPNARVLPRDEALAELTRRYFTSHGPATLRDFAWWSGLKMSDVKMSVKMVGSSLTHETIENETYWFSPDSTPAGDISRSVYLLPNYDEFLIGYDEYSHVFDAHYTDKLDPRGNIVFVHFIVIGGEVLGTWKREVQRGEVIVTLNPFNPLSSAENEALNEAAERYGRFLGLPISILRIA